MGIRKINAATNKDLVLKQEGSTTIANAAVPQFNEVTEKNITSFHFHGNAETFPVTSIIVVPFDKKSEVLLLGMYDSDTSVLQLIRPIEIVNELMEMVFRVKQLFDMNTFLVSVSVGLLLCLVFLLSLRLRRRERQTMFQLGCSRSTIWKLQLDRNAFHCAGQFVHCAGSYCDLSNLCVSNYLKFYLFSDIGICIVSILLWLCFQ